MRNSWIKSRLKEIGKKQADLGKTLGLPTSRVAEIISGARKIQSSEVTPLARFLEWPPNKILGLISDPVGFTPNIAPSTDPLGPIRIMGAVQAGVFKETLEYTTDDYREISIPTPSRYARTAKQGLDVFGPSMNLVYPEGSTVVVVSVIHLGEDYQPKSGQRVVVQRTNDRGQMEATLKELRIDARGQAWLWPKSNHPEFQQPWRVPDNWAGTGDFDEHSDNLRITALVIGAWVPEP